MTPFELDILLWYHGHAKDHPKMFEDVPLWRPTIDAFKAEDLIRERDAGQHADALYFLAPRGRVLINHILDLPLPEQQWIMPKPSMNNRSEP